MEQISQYKLPLQLLLHPNDINNMEYIKVIWFNDFLEEPIVLYSELDSNRYETRKVEIFKDGSIGIASNNIMTRTTQLGSEPVPDLIEIGEEGEFVPAEISKDEFEEAWFNAMLDNTASITYLKGDATTPQGKGVKVIAHICNDQGLWGKGFVMALSKKWPETSQEYKKWFYSKRDFALGNVQYVQVRQDIFVANMVAQRDIKRKQEDKPIDYQALDSCLNEVAIFCLINNASVHMPRIGTGLAGGDWNVIEDIILKEVIKKNVSVTVYDLAPA